MLDRLLVRVRWTGRPPSVRRVLTVSILGAVLAAAAPAGAQVRAETRLEKDRYIAGEPVFVIVEVTNVGVQPVAYNGSGDYRDPAVVEVRIERVPQRPPLANAIASCVALRSGLSGGGSWIVDHPDVIAPGARRAFRYLLTGYDLGPGRYRLTAKGRVNLEWRQSYAPIDPSVLPAGAPVPRSRAFGEVVEGAAVDEVFDLVVETGSEKELRAAFAPLVADAEGPDVSTRVEARNAIMRLAPAHLEGAIVRWTQEAAARGDGTAQTGAEALARLATPSSRAALVQTATTITDGQQRAAVVRALAAAAAPDVLPFFRGVIADPSEAATMRQAAALGLGRIGTGEAIRTLHETLRTADPALARFVLGGLGLSRSRSAIGVLIDHVPRAADDQLRIGMHLFSIDGSTDLCDALATLTHLRFCRDGRNNRADLRQRLERWAAANAASAALYGNDACVAEEGLPFVE